MSGGLLVATSSQPPLSSIAERRSHSGGEESEEDEEDEEGGWRTQDLLSAPRGSLDETVIKAGYLWKKGERRKVRVHAALWPSVLDLLAVTPPLLAPAPPRPPALISRGHPAVIR